MKKERIISSLYKVLVNDLVDLFSFLGAFAPMRVVDGGVLEQGSEDEHETRDQVYIDGLYVADSRQRWSHTRTNRRHSEHGRYSQGHASRRRFVVDPKRHPREHDD